MISVSCAASLEAEQGAAGGRPVTLVLVEELTWEEMRETPSLEKTFEEGAAANLSTAQGAAPADPRLAYVLLGAGSRTDTSLLPNNLPRETTALPEAFKGPASPIRPGLLGEALAENGVETAAVGERAKLAVMDGEGRVKSIYKSSEPVKGLEDALADGAELVAVEAGSPEEAGRVSEAALGTSAAVAVASPNALPGSANLTPFVMVKPNSPRSEGLLYSPTTRTRGLISSVDVAPTLLAQLGVDPPAEMQGRSASVLPATMEAASRLAERLSFVAEKRFIVWLLVGAAVLAGAVLAVLWKRKTGAAFALLAMAALPAGALAVAAVPVTNAPTVAFLTLVFAAAMAAIFWRASGSQAARISGVFLAVSALILADTASGGTLMKFSTLGYDPAHGTRFYGIGNEYAAFLTGGLTMGMGAVFHRYRLPPALLLAVGVAAVLILALPVMGADVGGSLALGIGLGATLALIRGVRLPAVALWAVGGFFLAAVLFVLSGRLFTGVSHGSRAAGGETPLVEIAYRKLLLSLDLLLNPLHLFILIATLAVVLLGWRRVRGTALGAGLLGATIAALASGALNDSGILAAIYALAYPVAAAGILLITGDSEKTTGVR